MSFGSGEKAGLVGGALLAAGLVTAALLFFWPRGEGDERAREGDETAVGTAAAPAPGEKPPVETRQPGRPSRLEDLQREVRRLRAENEKKDEEIQRLRKLLAEAGTARGPQPPDIGSRAESAIRELASCGRETPFRDIVVLRNRIVALGPPAVPVVRAFLDGEEDVVFSDAWVYADSKRRFTSYPTLRTALIDALYRMGVEGQRALVTLLATDEDPLEICQMLALLADVESEEVRQARFGAARRYVALPPPRRESHVVKSVLDTLVGLAPDEAAESLLTYVRREGRRSDVVLLALRRIRDLEPAVAMRTLAALATAATPKSEAADRDLAIKAVEHLADLAGPGVAAALREVLATGPIGELRRAIYLSLDGPVSRGLTAAEEAGRKTNFGLVALRAFEKVEKDLAERLQLLEERSELEFERVTIDSLGNARKRLDELSERSSALRKRFKSE